MKVSTLLQKDPVQKARIQCRKKFLYYFKKGFSDATYKAWERQYKLDAHFQFQQLLNKETYTQLLKQKKYSEIALTAVKIESRTNLLFSFEKMALRDAIKEPKGAKAFAEGLFDYIYGKETIEDRFNQFSEIVSTLPRKQTSSHLAPSNCIWIYW